MGRRPGRWAVGFAWVICTGASAAAATAQIPWDEDAWTIAAQESRVETYLGREALYLRGGTAWLEGSDFRDGVIEFDMAASGQTGFHGLRLRAVDRLNHEHVYLRPHLSDRPDAVQYNPIYHGVSAWQLYSDERYVLPAVIPPERWVHVRVGVQGRRMEVRVDDQLLVFPHLVRDPVSGALGVNSSGAPARFANVVVRPGADPGFSGGAGAAEVATEPGTVASWRISEPFAETLVDGVPELPASLRSVRTWQTLEPEVRGIANIARLHGVGDGANTVLAALTLVTERAGTARVRLGFSDRARVFLNGRQLWAGSDAFGSRDYRFLGTIGLFDEVFLPLERGDNDLRIAVSETFGGWGITLQIPEGQSLRVR